MVKKNKENGDLNKHIKEGSISIKQISRDKYDVIITHSDGSKVDHSDLTENGVTGLTQIYGPKGYLINTEIQSEQIEDITKEEKKVIKAMEIQEKILKEFPLKIKDMEEELYRSKQKRDESILKNKMIDLDVYGQIFDEKDGEGKAFYKNEDKRRAAVNKRLSVNRDFKENQDIIDKLTKKILTDEIVISYMKRVNTNASPLTQIYIFRLGVGE